MFRKQLRRLIPNYAAFPLMMTGLMNLFAFQVPKVIQMLAPPSRMYDMTTAFDLAVPFSPVWVLAYIGTFVFWTYQNVAVARESAEKAYRLAAADFTAKLICFLFYIIMPTTNVRPEVTGNAPTDWLMRFIYWIDTPTNLFPSIHCFVAWLGTRMMYDRKDCKHKTPICTLCTIGSLAVFLSTLFTKQHVIWDVVSGVAVAELGYLVARFTPLPQVFARIDRRLRTTRPGRFLFE